MVAIVALYVQTKNCQLRDWTLGNFSDGYL